MGIPQVSHLLGFSLLCMWTFSQLTTFCELFTTGITFIMFLPSVDTNMLFGYKHVFWLRIVHHRCHILKVSTQYRYGNVSLMHHLLRSVHHITTYITFIGFLTSMDTDVSSNHHLMRSMHHMYHIRMVSHQYGYGHVSSNLQLSRTMHQRYHILNVSPQEWIRACVFK